MLKPHPPPTAGEAIAASYGPLVAVIDLSDWAQQAGLPLVMLSGDLANEAERLERAMKYFSLGTRLLSRVAPAALKRDWCEVVSQQAHDLLLTLGHLDDARLGGGARFRDGMQTLGQHRPGPRADAAQWAQLEQMARHLDFQRFEAARLAGESGVNEVWWHFMHQKMPAALEMLLLLARCGVSGYARHLKHGGRDREIAQGRLFDELIGSYERLFGALPTIGRADAPDETDRSFVPAGPSLDWFKCMFATVRNRARELARDPVTGEPVPDAELDPQVAAIVRLANRTLKAGKPADALARAIRDATTRHLARS